MQQGTSMQQQGAGMPPPPPQAAVYHLSVNGQQQGPYPIQQLQQMAQNGQLTPDTYVWTNGMSGWEAAKNIPALASLFGTPPPPPPTM